MSANINFGDKVNIDNGNIGIIRFIGQTDFAIGLWYGIELFEKKGINDGSIHGINYFQCPPKHGIFVRRERILNKSYSLGDKIKLVDSRCGEIMFIGETRFSYGMWYGIKLDYPGGKHNGSVNGVTYFQCNHFCGVFVRFDKIDCVLLKNSREPYVKWSFSDHKHSGSLLGSFKRSVSSINSCESPNIEINDNSRNGGDYMKHIGPLSSNDGDRPEKGVEGLTEKTHKAYKAEIAQLNLKLESAIFEKEEISVLCDLKSADDSIVSSVATQTEHNWCTSDDCALLRVQLDNITNTFHTVEKEYIRAMDTIRRLEGDKPDDSIMSYISRYMPYYTNGDNNEHNESTV